MTFALPAAPGWLTLIVSTTLRMRLAARLAAFVGLRRIFTVPARPAVAWPRATMTVEAAAKPRVAMRAAEAPPFRCSLARDLLGDRGGGVDAPGPGSRDLERQALGERGAGGRAGKRTLIVFGRRRALAPPSRRRPDRRRATADAAGDVVTSAPPKLGCGRWRDDVGRGGQRAGVGAGGHVRHARDLEPWSSVQAICEPSGENVA